MNKQFQSWFSEGNIAEALAGLGGYFTPDVTYRDEHDFGLGLRELIEWANNKHVDLAARGFETALIRLLQTNNLKSALLLLRSYSILQEQNIASLPINYEFLISHISQSVHRAAEELSRDESLRNLLLLVSQDFPALKAAIGIR